MKYRTTGKSGFTEEQRCSCMGVDASEYSHSSSSMGGAAGGMGMAIGASVRENVGGGRGAGRVRGAGGPAFEFAELEGAGLTP